MRTILVVILLAGCSGATERDPRAAWLEATLIEDNRPWLERDPALVADKLAMMATRRYDYFRGTAGQYWRDVTEGGGPVDATTGFGDGPSSLVWIDGDPHLENIGTFRAGDGDVLADVNDFDAAGFGPWWDDLRRLAVALRLACADATTLSDADADRVVRAAVAGYAGDAAAQDPVLDDLIAKGKKVGDEGRRLAEYTRIDGDGTRTMFYGDVDPPRQDGIVTNRVVPVDGREATLIATVIARWRTSLIAPLPAAAAAIKGASRRLGAGVSSYPLLRYYVLIEGPTAAVEDDVLLELKEEAPGPRIALAHDPGFTSEGERVVQSQRALGARPDEDALLGWADVAPGSWKVRERSSYQLGLDETALAAAIDAGDYTLEDLTRFAGDVGHRLARMHAAAPTAGGAHGGDVIAPLIAGRADALADETARFAAAYAAQVDADQHALIELLAADGPILGYR